MSSGANDTDVLSDLGSPSRVSEPVSLEVGRQAFGHVAAAAATIYDYDEVKRILAGPVMRVLVTGGSGKLGTFVVKELMPDCEVLEWLLTAELQRLQDEQ